MSHKYRKVTYKNMLRAKQKSLALTESLTRI